MPLPPAVPLVLSEGDRKELLGLSRQRSIAQGILLQVNIVLGTAEGRANRLLARDLSTTVTRVLLWRKRFEETGVAGLLRISLAVGVRNRRRLRRRPPSWRRLSGPFRKMQHTGACAPIAASQKVSPATVLRIWKKHKLQPHSAGIVQIQQ